MFTKGFSRCFFIIALTGIWILLTVWTVPAHAQFSVPQTEPECISCHENLYFLHDTGKWFCLNEETPMTCVGCHGGNPSALTKELAHANRSAHPIINDNTSKCTECHQEQCSERVKIFGQEAGISLVMVSQPYKPAYTIAETQSIPVTGNQKSSEWVPAVAGILFILAVGLAVTIYTLYRIYSNKNLLP